MAEPFTPHEIQVHGIDYIDVKAASEILGVTFNTTRRYQSSGFLPQPEIKIGQSVFWRKTTIEEFHRNRNRSNAPKVPEGKLQTLKLRAENKIHAANV